MVLLALILGFGIMLMQSVPPAAPDRTEHYEAVAPLPPLVPGATITQRISPVQAGELHVLARFGTYGGAQDCQIAVEVRTADGTVSSDRVIECADLEDNALAEVAVLSEKDAVVGELLTVEFRADVDGTEAVALWGGKAERGGPARVDSEVLDVSVELYTRYGSEARLVDRLGSVLSRAQQYRAWWGAPAAMVILLLIVVVGVAALALVPARMRLPLLLVVVAAKGIFWSVLLPPLETPDEPAHVAYAQYVAEELRIPDRYELRDGRGPYSDQILSAIDVVRQPLLNPGDRPDYGSGPEGPDEAVPDDESPHSGGGGNPAAGYAPPYFIGAAVAYALPPADFFASLSTMRLWSVALGVVTIWLVVGIGRRAFRDETAALALALAVAFQPVWTQATAAVNNDAAVVLAGAACTLVALDLALRPERARLPLIAGLTLGAALLTKPFAAAFVGPLVLGWLVGRMRGRGVLERSWLRDLGGAALGVGVTFGTWVLISTAFGIPMVTTDDSPVVAGARTPGQYLHRLTANGFHTLQLNWVDRLWGNLSWTDTPPPSIVDNVMSRITLVVLGLGAAWLILTARDVVRQRRQRRPAPLSADAVAALVLGTAVASSLVLLHVIELRWFLRTGDNTLLAGRYLMMALPAIIGVIPLLVRRVVPQIPIAATAAALAAGVIGLHLIAIDTILDRFYL